MLFRSMLMSQQYLNAGLERTGAVNYVTSILLDFRGYDTLGEATIIFVAIVGVYTVLRPVGRIRAGVSTSREGEKT